MKYLSTCIPLGEVEEKYRLCPDIEACGHVEVKISYKGKKFEEIKLEFEDVMEKCKKSRGDVDYYKMMQEYLEKEKEAKVKTIYDYEDGYACIHVRGLRPLMPTIDRDVSFYQCWIVAVKKEKVIPVSLFTFNTNDCGETTMGHNFNPQNIAGTGMGFEEFSYLMVTAEPLDGQPKSKEKVMIGYISKKKFYAYDEIEKG